MRYNEGWRPRVVREALARAVEVLCSKGVDVIREGLGREVRM